MPFIFPLNDTPEIPYWILFQAAEYNVLAVNRTRSAISSRAFDYIQLPLPLDINIETSHTFSEGVNPVGPILSAAGEANSPGGRVGLLRRAFLDPILANFEALSSTSTIRRFTNLTEMSLVGEARREFKFGYTMVPKDFNESSAIGDICEAFRVASYPEATSIPERVFPPPLWRIQVIGQGNSEYLTRQWLGDPLVCVLTNVSINKIPFGEQTPAKFFQDGSPAATSLTLTFKEFEQGTYKNGLVFSKSEISAGV